MKRIATGYLMASLALFLVASSCRQPPKSLEEQLAEFFSKKEVTILVTDSGLGGLSIAAPLYEGLKQHKIFNKARIVFFSALFKKGSGYNSLKCEEEKARIFDKVLEAMQRRYHPDLLLIGCNTLSVVYHNTAFSRRPSFPVLGIVETGVEAIQKKLAQFPQATIIIFATRTTISSKAHQKLLVEQGAPANKIIGQACHKLAGAINRGYDSEETMTLLRKYIKEALDKLPSPPETILASLNCTDYGYALDQFKQVFNEYGYSNVIFVDPNPFLAEKILKPSLFNRFPRTEASIEVVSKTPITEKEITSIGSLLEKISPATASALRNYTFNPKLF